MPRPKVTNAQARTTALLLLGSGAFFLKFGYFNVLRDAEANTTMVTSLTKIIVFAPAFLMIGLVLLVTGAPAASSAIGRLMARPEDGEIAPLGIALLLATLLPGVVLYMWLMHRLAQLGFH